MDTPIMHHDSPSGTPRLPPRRTVSTCMLTLARDRSSTFHSCVVEEWEGEAKGAPRAILPTTFAPAENQGMCVYLGQKVPKKERRKE